MAVTNQIDSRINDIDCLIICRKDVTAWLSRITRSEVRLPVTCWWLLLMVTVLWAWAWSGWAGFPPGTLGMFWQMYFWC